MLSKVYLTEYTWLGGKVSSWYVVSSTQTNMKFFVNQSVSPWRNFSRELSPCGGCFMDHRDRINSLPGRTDVSATAYFPEVLLEWCKWNNLGRYQRLPKWWIVPGLLDPPIERHWVVFGNHHYLGIRWQRKSWGDGVRPYDYHIWIHWTRWKLFQ